MYKNYKTNYSEVFLNKDKIDVYINFKANYSEVFANEDKIEELYILQGPFNFFSFGVQSSRGLNIVVL